MKKTLLLGSFAIIAMAANAQQYVTEVSTDFMVEAGFVEGEKVSLDGGLIFGEGEAGTIEIAYTDSWGMSAPCGDYKYVKVGDVELTLSQGAVGDNNPTFGNYASGVMSTGAVFKIVPAHDGWLTIFTKMSPNKQYVVFEGKTTGMSYTTGFSNGTTSFHYTLPATSDYAIDFTAADASNYFIAAGGEGPEDVKPQFPYLVVGLADNPGNGTAFFTFNVLGGNDYYFSALGSKAPCGSFVLTEGDTMPVVTFLANEEKGLPQIVFEGEGSLDSGVGSIVADSDNANAPVYNVLGQKVGADAKGILIQNGKKFIRK